MFAATISLVLLAGSPSVDVRAIDRARILKAADACLESEPATVTLDPPLELASGGGFRFTCEYDNLSANPVGFGESAEGWLRDAIKELVGDLGSPAALAGLLLTRAEGRKPHVFPNKKGIHPTWPRKRR